MAGLSWSITVVLRKLESLLESNKEKSKDNLVSAVYQWFSRPPQGRRRFEEKYNDSLRFLDKKLKSLIDLISFEENIHGGKIQVPMAWLQRLESDVYDAEDVVDEILYEATRSKLEPKAQPLKDFYFRFTMEVRRLRTSLQLTARENQFQKSSGLGNLDRTALVRLAQLKLCFAYCSLFPRGYVFDKEGLILLWMAAGLLQNSTTQSMEQSGAQCFISLLMESFFIPVNSGFKMHDNVLDHLADVASEEVYLRLESNSIIEFSVTERIRHLSFPRRHHGDFDLNSICKLKSLRTLYQIDYPPSGHGSYQLSAKTLKAVFASLKRLRILSLSHFKSELPAEIGELKILHYLDLSHSTLTKLPESLCTLYHLQTLILTNCSYLLMLPQGIVKLLNLRKLDIKGTGLKKMPEEMSRLTSLQSLSDFIIGRKGSSIKELGALLNLHGSLSVSMLENVSSASDASAANLKSMQYLDELELQWSGNNEDSAAGQEEVLDNLKPSGKLRKLSIQFYGGHLFPRWLGESSLLKNITSLHLRDCRNCVLLPPLGQLSSLEHLIVENFSRTEVIGHEFFGVHVSGCKPFQSLKTLKFEKMSEWKVWELLGEAEGEEFPCLEELYIISCPKLIKGLPKSLPTLINLEIDNCKNLMGSLPKTSVSCSVKLVNSEENYSKIQKRGETNKNPAEQRELQENIEPSGELENYRKIPKRSDDNQTVLPRVSPSLVQQDQDENRTKLSSSEDGNQQFSSSLEMPSDLHDLRIERHGSDDNQTVSPQASPSIVQEDQDDTQTRPSSSEYENHQFSSSMEMPTDLNSLRIERHGNDDNQIVSPQASPSIVQQDQDDTRTRPSSSEYENHQFSSSMEMPTDLNSLRIDGNDDNQIVSPQASPSIVQQDQDDTRTRPSSSEAGNHQFSSSMEMPSDLHTLRIERCASSMLPKEILERSSLQHLYLIDCVPLRIFPLSPSLKTLYIHNCKSLEFPQPNKLMNQLEDLCLGSSCDSLETFPLSYFPKLKSLSLWDCRNLEYLYVDKALQTELTSLDALEIKDCPKLRSFLEGEVQAPKLTSLVLFNCVSLKSLQPIQSFQSLQSLCLNKCPALESLPMEGLPSGLIILCISFCDKITPQKGWNLDKLHSLSHFEIEGGCQTLKSFPEEGLLPTSLNSLRISGLLNLTSLDREGLQKLTSLQTLEINSCNKLDSLPEHRLPSSLSSLSITECSLLSPKLRNRKGKEWFKIAHIPSVLLDEDSD